jgi:intracellular sulfur oxidation DsrE/DsrF family protein
MKINLMRSFLFAFFALASISLSAQQAVNPLIKSFGTVSTVPNASFTPDPSLDYKIIVDVMSGGEDKSEVFFSLNNVARLLNLHAMAGVPKERLHVVVAIHNAAVWSVLSDAPYKERFGVTNPHTLLFNELIENGVKVVVCGQSLIKQKITHDQLIDGIEVATSALTTLTEYQLRGYALLKF